MFKNKAELKAALDEGYLCKLRTPHWGYCFRDEKNHPEKPYRFATIDPRVPDPGGVSVPMVGVWGLYSYIEPVSGKIGQGYSDDGII